MRIPSTPLLDLHMAPNSTAWRMGGANDTFTYLALPRRDSTAHRVAQRKKAGQKARYTADPDMMDAVATTLDNAWGPRRLKGWCSVISEHLC